MLEVECLYLEKMHFNIFEQNKAVHRMRQETVLTKLPA